MNDNQHALFHESYFEHPCTVVTEKDVLDMDIRGNGRCAKLRRWFHSWFLLSYDDERCRVYFVSSHALRLERARHFQCYRGRIHPLSKFSNVWAVIIFVVLVLNRSVFHLNTAMLYGKQTAFTIIFGALLEIILMLDLIVNFKTGYTEEVSRNVVLDANLGYAHYVSTKFFLHVSSAMPLQIIMMIRYGISKCLLCKANLFVCTLKLLAIFNLIRLYDASSFLSQQRNSFAKMNICKSFRIAILAFLTILHFLDFADTINLIMILQNQYLPKDSYMSMIMRIRIKLHHLPSFFFMCVEFSILCKSVVLFGYGMYRHDYYLDKICSLICHVISCAFCTWAFMECFAIVHRQKYINDENIIHKKRTYSWMRSMQLSNMISEKVTDYQKHMHGRLQALERYNKMYNSLPSILTKEVKLSCYYKHVRRIPCFSEWPVDVVEDVVLLMKEEMFLENDVVSHPLTHGDGLVIVYAGVLAVYNSAQKETGHLIDGDYFGELSLVTDKELRTSNVIAVTACEVNVKGAVNNACFCILCCIQELFSFGPSLVKSLFDVVLDLANKQLLDAKATIKHDASSKKINFFRRFQCNPSEPAEQCKARYIEKQRASNGSMVPLSVLLQNQTAIDQFAGPNGMYGAGGKIRVTQRFYRRTTPILMSFLNDCDYTIYYCMKTYRTGAVCGRITFGFFYTFSTYCMLDFMNCIQKWDRWSLAYIGECNQDSSSGSIRPFMEYKHYPYENDYFLDQYYPIEYGHPGK